MNDKIKKELETLKARRRAMRKDLEDLAVELSATSQVVIIFELARLENEIREMEQELESMAFEEFMREKWIDGER